MQRNSIPLILNHKDVVVEAVTGSGKTLAFLIPVLELLFKANPSLKPTDVGAIILSPTRELAQQTFKVLGDMMASIPGELSCVLLMGGNLIQTDVKHISNGCNIIVATPGRLLEIFKRFPNLNLKPLEVLILDEADRLLNLGFENTLHEIIKRLPKQRRTGLYSATMSDALSELIRTGLRCPVKVTVRVENAVTRDQQNLPEGLAIYYHICRYDERLGVAFKYLELAGAKKTIIFFGTCSSVEYFGKVLPHLESLLLNAKQKIFALHGRMDQRKRLRIYQEFIEAPEGILLCTDVAARGLDFQDIDLIIQYEAPQDPATFVHRCGRTARSGRIGKALLLLAESEDAYLSFLENRQISLAASSYDIDGSSLVCSEQLRAINISDRDFYDKSVKAFVAFIRFYQEHHAKFIFRLKDLGIGEVANSLGLLRLPKMKELKGLTVEGFTESSVDPKTIIYRDKARNRQRQAAFEKLKAQKDIREEKVSKVKDDSTYYRSARPGGATKLFKNELDMGELDEDWKEFKKAKKANK